MRKPKYFAKLVAWYYRNFKYSKSPDLYIIEFDSYKPDLFERLYTHNGITGVYLGKNKYLEVERIKFTKEIDFVNDDINSVLYEK